VYEIFYAKSLSNALSIVNSGAFSSSRRRAIVDWACRLARNLGYQALKDLT
jgi:hypothetical protein